jgi:hypothetical protein
VRILGVWLAGSGICKILDHHVELLDECVEDEVGLKVGRVEVALRFQGAVKVQD